MKKMMKICASFLVMLMMFSVALADEMGTPEDELNATAKYISDTVLKGTIDNMSEDDILGYNAFVQAVLCLKAGYLDEDVAKAMDADLAKQLEAYDETAFLYGTTNKGTATYAVATAILYVQERQEDPADYQGVNLLELLDETFSTEKDINPYAYQWIAAVTRLTDYDWAAAKDKIKADITDMFFDGEGKIGIDYWGVSVDNNGQCLPALLEFYDTDDEIKDMVNGALLWNMTQTDETGAAYMDNTAWGGGLDSNTDSTALGLRAASAFGKMEDAKSFYNAMAQFKTSTEGAYSYTAGGTDNSMATVDALYGLLAYVNALNGEEVFAVKNVVEEPTEDPVVTPETTPTVAPTATATPAPAKTDKAPKTGDDMGVYVALGFVALAGMAVLSVRKEER